MIENVQPFSIIDSSSFKALISELTDSRRQAKGRTAATKALQERAKTRKATLKALLAGRPVDRYCASECETLCIFEDLPALRTLFVTCNTVPASSASVERLFSLGGRVLTPLRCNLSDNHFEDIIILKGKY